jgi:hypothetical protein
MGELPTFWVFSLGTYSALNSLILHFFVLLSFSVRFTVFSLQSWLWQDSDVFLLCCLHMNMDDYPIVPSAMMVGCIPRANTARGFHRVFLCMLVRLGCDRPIPEYSCGPYQAHGLSCCEVWVEIPVNPEAPWTRMVVGGNLDDTVEKMAHLVLTVMCEQRLTDTIDMPLALFLKWEQDEPIWCQCQGADCDITGSSSMPSGCRCTTGKLEASVSQINFCQLFKKPSEEK